MSEDIKTALSVGALLVSLFSLWLTKRNWNQSNRPVVCAFIEEDSISDGVGIFNFKVANTGSRPATDVHIHFERGELEKLIDPKANSDARMKIAGCFGRDSKIPLLRNGEILSGGLGLSSKNASIEPQLSYGAEATIRIKYRDLEGNSYNAQQPIKVYPRNGFTGNVWESAA